VPAIQDSVEQHIGVKLLFRDGSSELQLVGARVVELRNESDRRDYFQREQYAFV
jgi:hypothetical protein